MLQMRRDASSAICFWTSATVSAELARTRKGYLKDGFTVILTLSDSVCLTGIKIRVDPLWIL